VRGASLLIVAISGRALAAAARRAGLVPLVADFFADADTARLAHACIKPGGDMRRGLRWTPLARSLEALAEAAPSPLLGLVYGAGFEDRPQLLEELARRWTVLGNDAGVVERVKDPAHFFRALARLSIAHPRTLTEPPSGEEDWLAKRQGGAGGSHVVASHVVTSHVMANRGEAGALRKARVYYQEKVEGRAIAALFVGNGEAARVLGFSEQWTAPTKTARWRYGGAVAPATLSPALERKLTETVERVAAAFGLKGLGSADFLVNDGEDGGSDPHLSEAHLLEINPRPGATLDVFDSEDQPLLALHLDAILERRLPGGPLALAGGSAAAIVYATEPVTLAKTMTWPDWTADQPRGGDRIDKNRPICTVWARSGTKAAARRLVEERIAIILAACG
jgi:predicted ATP-grasp superfamily ATP-dependent carboligase